ncbi:UPF0149 family protein [endosymbiont of unidentified scaly snail isolate Monju]|uniref:UPF0149 family protein n=1 Tax=endosymbiont of unidentified scaly snail isolate Monju TaxID=1248727 RepID=UPI0003892985|nr:UPF0149 family protein [endosymbiont of unidentified scaly snail isolate Monju]BAN68522.1 hypothetical protein EBS_0560 [endosymbiont of unidentified scaly snail isolate Monju]
MPETLHHDALARELAGHGCTFSPAWLHGALFGLIALHDDDHEAGCKRLRTLLAADDRLGVWLCERYRALWSALDGPGLDFGMPLPEGVPAERAQTVIDWTRGYLEALHCSGLDEATLPVAAGRHALDELRRIATAEPASLCRDEDGQEEAAEHAWVTAVLVRELLVVTRE